MRIDSLPVENIVDADGKLHPAWRNQLEQNTKQLQHYLSQERYLLPTQPNPRGPTANISGLNNVNNKGGMLYNSVTNSANINIKVPDGSGGTNHVFNPLTSYQVVADIPTRDAIPAAERNGQLVYVTGTDELYIGINGVWRKVTIT